MRALCVRLVGIQMPYAVIPMKGSKSIIVVYESSPLEFETFSKTVAVE